MPLCRSHIRFLLNDRSCELADLRPGDMLLDAIRLEHRLTGTKEGCAEGDCGACTVLVGHLEGARLRYQPINACIRPLASVDGCHVVTVEHLARSGLTPAQDAMVRHHGSQCGFCTPGIVMALHALWMETPSPSREQALTALQGNLCRCTGYAPILRAAQDMASGPDPLAADRAAVLAQLQDWQDGQRVEIGGAILPSDVDDLADVLLETPQATIIAGATDVGLWVTKSLRKVSPAVFLGHLYGLKRIDVSEDKIVIGAGVSYTDLMPVIAAHYPQASAYWSRIGGWQVRNAGTIGGNIANGSPIGDTPPWLIAMGATLTLRRGQTRRDLPVEAFFVEYGKQDLRPGEFVESITVPKPGAGDLLAVEKVSKRRDEDISSVSMAMRLPTGGPVPAAPTIAFGGMAGTPKRATATEAALAAVDWRSEAETAPVLAQALAQDFSPLSDQRASSAYRAEVARTLILRALRRFAEARP